MTGLRMTEAMSWKVVTLLKPATTISIHVMKNLMKASIQIDWVCRLRWRARYVCPYALSSSDALLPCPRTEGGTVDGSAASHRR